MVETQIDLDAADLRALVAHAHTVDAKMSVEAVQTVFAEHGVDFLGVLQGERFLGVCARRDLAQSLGSRFGFALNAHRPVAEHLMPSPLTILIGAPLTEVFRAVAERGSREFYDDVVLLTSEGQFGGLIPMRRLTQVQTGILLDNVAHLEQSRSEVAARSRQMEEELRMAREVQIALLPQRTAPLEVAGRVARVVHRFLPAGAMSGDFFDVIRLSDQTLGLLVCDVMGHGVRSALVTTMVRALLEPLHLVADDPGLLLSRLNGDLTRILRRAGGVIFVTAAYVVIELGTGKLRYAQAGHPAPLRWDAELRTFRAIRCNDEQAGPALGLLEDFMFETAEESIAPGDRIILYTDGLIEAISPAGEEFGTDRLAELLGRSAHEPIEPWIDGTLSKLATFTGGKFADDICIVAAEIDDGTAARLTNRAIVTAR